MPRVEKHVMPSGNTVTVTRITMDEALAENDDSAEHAAVVRLLNANLMRKARDANADR